MTQSKGAAAESPLPLPSTGGPAFPVRESALFNGLTDLSLRDYFAAQALQGLLAGAAGQPFAAANVQRFVTTAYACADAMLELSDTVVELSDTVVEQRKG